jgi:very-short-patch-repair endonuclease
LKPIRGAGTADVWRRSTHADRDQLLVIAGWRVVHFTRDQIKHDRAETGERLAALTTQAHILR